MMNMYYGTSHSQTGIVCKQATAFTHNRRINLLLWGRANRQKVVDFFMLLLFLLGLIGQSYEEFKVMSGSASFEQWVSVDQIAAHLSVKPDTVYKWLERKSMPAHKVGRLWRFKPSEVDKWVRSGKAAESNGTKK